MTETHGPAAPRSRQIVLLVEDDEVDREQVRRLLDRSYDVIEAVDGREGVLKSKERRPDCVLLDYRLPDVVGLELVRRLAALEMPVVVLTGQGSEAVAVASLREGAQEYVVKHDLGFDVLDHAIRNAVEKVDLEHRIREKQAELELFASVAAHDLKAPMRAVEQLCEVARDDLAEGRVEEALDALGAIQRRVGLTVGFIERLLDYARSGRSVEPQPVDLNQVLAEVLALLAVPIAEARAEVVVGELPILAGDGTALTQLFQNLISNGIKFQPRGVRPRVEVSATLEGDAWHCRVADNGVGVEAAQHEKIFAPLARAHGGEEFEGTGLGLAVCRRVVESHGGRIWVVSERGKGCEFHFTLARRP